MYKQNCIWFLVLNFFLVNSKVYSKELAHQDDKKGHTITPKKHSTFVGFTAWKQDFQNYQLNDTIVYEGIILNLGGGYDRVLNTFECPYDGVYFISVSCRLFGDNELRIEVVKNSERILYLEESNAFEDNYAATDSNSGLVYCSEGERIRVRAYDQGWIDGEPGIPYSTFTVIGMYQDGAVGHSNLHTSFVGSSVFKSQDQAYISGETINFDRIIYDGGNHFENDVFNCPVDGIYFVTINVRKTAFNSTQIGLGKGTYTLLHIDDVRGRNRFTTLSNSRLFRCSAGETVSVQGTGVGEVSGANNSPYTTFTVMLMQEDTSVASITDPRHLILVGFSAWKRDTQTYSAGDTIVFDGIFINIGGYYNTETSTFTCPIDGVYYVTVTLKRVLTADDLEIDVQVATSLLFRVNDFFDQNPGISVTNGALTRCFTGEEIVLKAAADGAVRGDASQSFSTFTVMLMYAEQ